MKVVKWWSRRLGRDRVGLWMVKHLVSPVDRLVVRATGGRVPPLSTLAVPTLLLSVPGRRTGRQRTTPLVFARDGERFLVANARPPGERQNPWVVNLRAAGHARVHVDRRWIAVDVRELDGAATDRWWPTLTRVWPSFQDHFEVTGERTVFMLEPTGDAGWPEAGSRDATEDAARPASPG